MNNRVIFRLVISIILPLNLLTPTKATGKLKILWISEHHDSVGDRSILNTGPIGYSQAATMAEEMGAVSLEVDDSVVITSDLLAPHSLVVLGVSETGAVLSQAEQDAIAAYVAEGGRLFVMCGGTGNAGAYANSVSVFFGVNFDIDSTIISAYAGTFVPDLLTAGVSSLTFIGPNYLVAESPAILLGMYGQNGLLARRDYGLGSAVFWGDDWVFMNDVWDDVDNKRFAENVFLFGQITSDSQEDLLIWPLWEGRTWTYHCQDSNNTAWIETREVIDSNNLGDEQYYKVRITNNYPYAPKVNDVYVRSTHYAFYEWKNGREVMIIVAGPVGIGILNGDTVREIMSEDLMTVPYGGPYESYTYEIRDVNDTSPYSLASFVQGLGFIKIVDYTADYPPVIKELQSIVPDHLCGDYGYPYPVGDEKNHDCIVNFQDLGVIAENWLVCTKPDC
jgi:hypothetical protein